MTAQLQQQAESAATSMILNLLRALLFLLSRRIYVISFNGYRTEADKDVVVIKVSHSPQVDAVFGPDVPWSQRKTINGLQTYTHFAERFGVRIEWEVNKCA